MLINFLWIIFNLITPLNPKENSTIAEKVYANLWYTIGEMETNPPVLEIRNSMNCVASYIPNENKIIIETKALDVIRSFGPDSLNALAFILSHELVHFLQKQVEGDHTSNFLSYDVGGALSHRAEKQADIQGSFIAYLSGYKTTHLIGSLLEKLYAAYDLTDKTLYGYPSLNERQFSGEEAMEKAEELIYLNDAANYLSISGNYSEAAAAYNYILKFYPGPDIYHNLGVQYIEEALHLSDHNIDRFIYPTELDPQTRLKKPFKHDGVKSLDILSTIKRANLLQDAQNAFESALKRDSSRGTHHLHLLITLCLSEQLEKASKYYHSLPESIRNQKETKWEFEWIFGIIEALSGNEISAKNAFSIIIRDAPAEYTQIANINRHLVNLKASGPLLKDYSCPLKPAKDVLSNKSIQFSISLEDSKNTLFGYVVDHHNKILCLSNQDKYVKFYEFPPKKFTTQINSLPVMKKGKLDFYHNRDDQVIYVVDSSLSILTEIYYIK